MIDCNTIQYKYHRYLKNRNIRKFKIERQTVRKNVIEKCILTSFITIFIRDILIKNITYSLLKGKCRELSLHHLQNVFLYIFNQNIMSKILLVCYKNRITNGHVTKINSFALKEGETTSEIKFLVFFDHEN